MVTDLLYTKTWFILTRWGLDKIDAIFPDNIFKYIFLNANIWISIKFSLKFVWQYIAALVQILNSTVCSTDCLGKHQCQRSWSFEGNPSVTDGFSSQKVSNAASVGPMLVQRWHTTIGVTLCQRWPNVSAPTLGRCWHNVGSTLVRDRWANVGPIDKSTLAQRGWADVGPT